MRLPTITVAIVAGAAASTAVAGGGFSAQSIANLTSPIYLTHAGDGSGRRFVIEQDGDIEIIRANGTIAPVPFLDLSPISSSGGERGLLGLAFHPDYANNALFYVNYTNNAGDTVVAEYQTTAGNPAGATADPTSARTIIVIDQPFSNHNGGWIGFGPDGFLYISMGDGGSGNDPLNAGQDITNQLLGKMLRLDIDGDDFPGDPNRNYAIPASNPFVGVAGDDEIFFYGLRNAWRNSFDRDTGDMWIGDVGQNAREEINFVEAPLVPGQNFGWRCREGFIQTPSVGCPLPPGATQPEFDFASTGANCSVTGGYIYRGCAIPELDGQYLYGDFCAGDVIAYDPMTGSSSTLFAGGFGLTSFGEDEDGEIYFMRGSTVFKIVPNSFPDVNENGIPDTCEGPLPCSDADFADPIGSLDFNDVVAFLTAFSAGDPAADLADPIGFFDFNDVVAYLGLFAAGCP